MQLLTAIEEILTVFGRLQNVKNLKLIPQNNTCIVLSSSQKFSFFHRGILNEKVDGLPEVIGVGDLSLLRSIIDSPGFKNSSSTATYFTSTKLSAAYILFENATGHSHKFPAFSECLINERMPIGKLKSIHNFNVEFFPDADGVCQFEYWQKKLSDYQGGCNVGFYTKKGNMYCRYKFSNSDMNSFLFSDKVVGDMEYVSRYLSKDIVEILSFYPTTNFFKICISDKYLMKINIKRNLADYIFYISPLWEDRFEIESPQNIPADLPTAIEDGFGRNMDVEKYIEDKLDDD